MWAFSQASASLDTVTPANDVIIRVGLSPSGSEQEVISSESQGGSSAQTCFLPEAQGDGFLLARVLSNPSQIALQRLSIRVQPSSSHALAKAPALPAVVCQFPAAVQPKCLRLVNDEQMDVVYLIVLTEQGVLYRLVLPAPLYCYSSLSDIETSATQHSVSYLQSRPSAQAITFEILDEDTLLLALNDGALLQLQQNRLDDHARGTSLCRHEDAWQETALLAHSSWSIFQHHQDAKDTSVSIAAFYGQSDISDTGFTLSRDKTVKVWNLNRHKLIKSFDLAQLCSCFTASEHSISKEDVSSSKSTAGNTSLFHSMPLPYLRVVHADAINADYAAFLIIYAPQARAFLFFGIDVDDAGQVAQLVPVLQKPVDVSYASAELVDLRCEKVDRNALVGKQLDAEHSWTLWTLWAIGKQSHMTLMELPGLETMASSPSEELLKSNWVPILRPALPDVMQPVTEVTLDMLPPELQTDVTAIATLVGDRYLDHLFLPTRYSLPVLEAALQTYMETSNAVRPPTDAFMALRDIMPTVISSIVSLKTSASTGQSLVEEYKQDLEHEWMRLTALANELKLEAGFPLSLSVNTSKSGAHVMALERDSINTPTIQNQATLLRAQAASPSSEAFLSIPEEQLAESYPQLAPVSIREAVLTLCQSARHLVATVDSADNGRLSEELISLTCAMPVSTISEAAADIYDDVIAPSPAYVVQDREQALASIADLSQLPEAFDALLSVLMDPSLAQIPLEGPQPGLEEQAPSALCLSLVTAIAIDALESRFLLAQDIVSLLCMLRTEQPDLLENIDETINYYFAAYHRLFNLRSLSQSPSVPESANDIDATNDSLAAHLNALSVHVQAIHPTTSLEAFSLLNALFRNTPQSPEAICFAPCADLLALSTTLLSSTNQFSHSGSIEGGFDEASFAYRLFALGFAFEALSFCDTYPKCPLLDYVRGRALLEMDNLVDAKDAFELAAVDTDSIAQMLGRPSEPRVETLALYYGHIADLFFNHDAREEVFAFTSLAVSSGLEEETETIQREIWLRLFQSVNETSRFHDAYSTMIRVPYSDLKSECLRQMVSAMCESGETSALLSFPFVGMKEELENQLAFRAWTSDPRATPSYPNLLYSLLVSRCEYRKAATTMYTHARRLGHVDLRKHDFENIATARCQSYLSAISALSLLPERERWLCCDSSNLQTDHSEDTSARKPALLTVLDIRKEYTQALARLQLASLLPELATSVRDLSPDTVVALYAQQGYYEKALASAQLLGVDMAPLFESIARKCMKLDSSSSSRSFNDFDASWVFEDPITQSWSGTLATKAWQLLFHYLDEYDDATKRFHEAVADTVLSQDGDLPSQLVKRFEAQESSILARLLVKHGALNTAISFCIGVLQAVSRSKATSYAGQIPWTTLDILVNAKDAIIDHEMQSSLRQRIREHTARLAQPGR